MTQKPISIRDFLRVPTGTEVYDALMQTIEPELVTANIKHLDHNHKNESKEQRAARYKRYEKAYAQYDSAFEKWLMQLSAAVGMFRRLALKTAEAKSRKAEGDAISTLESQLAAATPTHA